MTKPARSESPKESERRIWVRYPSSLESFCQPSAGTLENFWWQAQIKDVSLTGMGLIVNRRFEKGTLLSFELNAKSQGVALQAEVVHVAEQPGGKWVLGCSFAKNLTENELQALR